MQITPQNKLSVEKSATESFAIPAKPNSEASADPVHPFRIPIFKTLWIATLVSNMGTWMQEVANSWLMTSLAPDPLMVSLVQVATALPMFMLGLPAGALADLVDKRRWLLGTQAWMMISAFVMALITLGGMMTPWMLLIGSFCLAVGAALNSPGWHSVTPEIVPKESLQEAVTLNGVVINCARALGPAVGGLVVVKMGPGAAFALNAVSFLAVVFALASWKRAKATANLPSEKFFSAMRVGVQHVRHSPIMRLLVLRAGILVFMTSAVWALLPLLCRQEYGFGARGYSMMLVCNAIGAIFGATYVLPRIRQKWEANQIVSYAWLGFCPTILVLSLANHPVIPFLAMLWGGLCNILMLSSFHLSAQSVAPEWVRARAMAVYLLTFSGATTFGAVFWGFVASGVGLRPCLQLATASLLIAGVTSWIAPLKTGESFDHSPSNYWPDPELKLEVPLSHGPIMVVVDYEVSEENSQEFLTAMERLRRIRYRNGVVQWSMYVDMENPRIYHEVYLEENWAAHLRCHERVSNYEMEVSKLAYEYHVGPELPRVRHLAYCDKSFRSGEQLEYFHEAQSTPQVPLWFQD